MYNHDNYFFLALLLLQFIAVALTLFAAAAGGVSGRPRFLVVDLDDVEFVGEQPQQLPVVPMEAMYNQRRFARAAQDSEEINNPFTGRNSVKRVDSAPAPSYDEDPIIP